MNKTNNRIHRMKTLAVNRVSALKELSDDTGQATVEYALVILGAAAIAGMLLAWAVNSGVIGQLMTTVVNSVISDASLPML